MRLDGYESGTVRIEEAVIAFRKALQERIRARTPLDWARTQMYLGNALTRLGEYESGKKARLEEAVAAYHEALREVTRKRTPDEWAMTTGWRGVTLAHLAERSKSTDLAEEAYNKIALAYESLSNAGDVRTRIFQTWLTSARRLLDSLRNKHDGKQALSWVYRGECGNGRERPVSKSRSEKPRFIEECITPLRRRRRPGVWTGRSADEPLAPPLMSTRLMIWGNGRGVCSCVSDAQPSEELMSRRDARSTKCSALPQKPDRSLHRSTCQKSRHALTSVALIVRPMLVA